MAKLDLEEATKALDAVIQEKIVQKQMQNEADYWTEHGEAEKAAKYETLSEALKVKSRTTMTENLEKLGWKPKPKTAEGNKK